MLVHKHRPSIPRRTSTRKNSQEWLTEYEELFVEHLIHLRFSITNKIIGGAIQTLWIVVKQAVHIHCIHCNCFAFQRNTLLID